MNWIRNKKIILAVGTGTAAAVLSGVHLARLRRHLETRFEMTRVLTARRYVVPGKPLTPELVQETVVPVAYVQPTALRSIGELKDPSGRTLWRPLAPFLKGEQITRSRLAEARATLGLAWTLASGERAVSFHLAPEQAVAGLVRPGDWVDGFLTLDRQPGVSVPLARRLFGPVQVLAVQDAAWDPAAGSVVAAEKTPAASVPTEPILVTLRLASRQASLSLLAAERGKITLALVSPLEAAPSVPPTADRVRLTELP
jgi:Flp pilus assembly protein CpaB